MRPLPPPQGLPDRRAGAATFTRSAPPGDALSSARRGGGGPALRGAQPGGDLGRGLTPPSCKTENSQRRERRSRKRRAGRGGLSLLGPGPTASPHSWLPVVLPRRRSPLSSSPPGTRLRILPRPATTRPRGPQAALSPTLPARLGAEQRGLREARRGWDGERPPPPSVPPRRRRGRPAAALLFRWPISRLLD